MVVPFAAGGPVDTLTRFMAERMRPLLGQPIIIENMSGAGGTHRCRRASRERRPMATRISQRHLEHARRQRRDL